MEALEKIVREAERLVEQFSGTDFEPANLQDIAALTYEINELKKEKNAIILAHHYMKPAIKFGIADFTGDSLELSRKAQETDADLIVFCGVGFMAETAKILNPDSKVILPDLEASCSLVDGFTHNNVVYPGLDEKLCRDLKNEFPGLPLVSYVNSTAAVKAESYACCTSANSVEVIEKLGDKVIFVPDANMAKNISLETDRSLVQRETYGEYTIFDFKKKTEKKVDYETAAEYVANNRVLISTGSKCMVHEQFDTDQIDAVREEHPGIKIVSHLECGPDVYGGSDYNGSTSGMINYISKTQADEYFMITECNMGSTLMQQFPEKNFYTPCIICPHMWKITLQNTLDALRNEKPEVKVGYETAVKARKAVKKMIELTGR